MNPLIPEKNKSSIGNKGNIGFTTPAQKTEVPESSKKMQFDKEAYNKPLSKNEMEYLRKIKAISEDTTLEQASELVRRTVANKLGWKDLFLNKISQKVKEVIYIIHQMCSSPVSKRPSFSKGSDSFSLVSRSSTMFQGQMKIDTSKSSHRTCNELISRFSQGIKEAEQVNDREGLASLALTINLLEQNPWYKNLKEKYPDIGNKIEELKLDLLISSNYITKIFEQKESFAKWTVKHGEGNISNSAVYNFISGEVDTNNQKLDIGVQPEEYGEYYNAMFKLCPNRIVLSIQGGSLDKTIEDRENWYQKEIGKLNEDLQKSGLPEQQREYIRESMKKDVSHLSAREKDDIGRYEYDTAIALDKEKDGLGKTFKKLLGEASNINGKNRGFIHFSRSNSSKETPKARIYLQMPKDPAKHALLVEILLKKYLTDEFPGIFKIKVASPGIVGRMDSIVIYIGQENAEEIQSKVIDELIRLQNSNPELFGESSMPGKINVAPGIGMTSSPKDNTDSFTVKLSQKIAKALEGESDVEFFRQRIKEELRTMK